MSERWQPAFGASVGAAGVRLRAAAPGATAVRARIDGGPAVELTAMGPDAFEAHVPGVRAGARYQLQRDDDGEWPDPYSRWQPEGVHGPSMVIDPAAFAWTDQGWCGVPRHRLVIYELHVGTFTPEGTFAAAAARLPELADLGVTAIELMPVAAFPGNRNWGYDGAALFAPADCYGHPDDLRALVDQAHGLGLAVLLDVVYNHLGPDGAYVAAWLPTIFSERHSSPWGQGINLDGPGSALVRRMICDNALHWLLEYHMDGLRLDATHALTDDSPEHILAQLAREVGEQVVGREVHLIAEDERNLDTLLHPLAEGGYGMTGVWADDFHHAMRRRMAGDNEAWFADFAGDTEEIAAAVRDGWVFTGQHATHLGRPRGTSPDGVAIEASVICLQNHDQIGNRAHGERLHHQVDHATWLAASTLLLTAPETPLLFMGQEWAASTPFLYFTDHGEELGALVVEGRRREFAHFSAFSDADARAAIPSPQSERTWRASHLQWEERGTPPHAHVRAETRRLLTLRHAHLTAQPRQRSRIRCEPAGPDCLWLLQPSALGGSLLTFIDFSGAPTRALPLPAGAPSTAVHLLHATSPAADRSVVHTFRVSEGQLVFDTSSEPFGAVLHLPEATS